MILGALWGRTLRAVSFRTFVAADYGESSGASRTGVDFVSRLLRFSIAPLLISGYSKITLVDIRYIHPDYLARFIDFEGCDVLFLYSTLVLNNSETLK